MGAVMGLCAVMGLFAVMGLCAVLGLRAVMGLCAGALPLSATGVSVVQRSTCQLCCTTNGFLTLNPCTRTIPEGVACLSFVAALSHCTDAR